jgi:hypothetical protein
MYTKLEILEIFNHIKTHHELSEVCVAFTWLFENNFLQRTKFLAEIMLQTFTRVT